MTKYNVGDRVVYKSVEAGNPEADGATGVVERVDYYGNPAVKWDAPLPNGLTAHVRYPFPENISLIPEADPSFSVGDTVRVKDDVALDGGRHKGKVGTVHHFGLIFNYVVIPGEPVAVPFLSSEIEKHTPIKREFKVGDRVRLDNTSHWGLTAQGRTGTIIAQGLIDVDMTDGRGPLTQSDHAYLHITHLDEEPAPSDTAADRLRTRADELLAEVSELVAKSAELGDQAAAAAERASKARVLALQYRAVADDLEAQK